jgi:4-amino-4-deoxy-L-arabinose transferase-like glycosyltransferase
VTGVAGRVAFGRRTGIIAAALVAVYPSVWLYEREVMAETLALLGVATTIWLAYRFRAGPGVTGAVLLGVAVGALAMTRPELIALALFLVVPLVLRASGEWRQRITWLAAAGIGCAVVIAPWGIYNSTRFERPVPLTTGYGSAMLQGNCAPTYHGELLGYYELACVTHRGKSFSSDPSIADGEQRKVAFEFMGDNLSRVPVVIAARVGRTFGVFRPFQQVQLDRAGFTPAWVFRLGLFMYWALLPFAVAGAVIARRRGIPIYPLLVFPLAVLLSVLLTIGQTRYRVPAEIPLALLAAVGIETGLRTARPFPTNQPAATRARARRGRRPEQ